MTKTEQNQLALIVGLAVVAILFTIFPEPRGLIVDSATGGVTYAYDSFIVPVLAQVADWFTVAWNWLDGLLPW